MVVRWKPPEVFDGYRVIKPLGRGAMGEVYLGQDLVLDRRVAVKFVAPHQTGEQVQQRFLVEARAIARLQHPNVVTIYRIGEIEGRPYIVSEFVEGTRLDRLPRPLDSREVMRIGVGIAHGLAAAHHCGVLHRDIKPENAIRTAAGEVKLLDFGLAKIVEVKVEVEVEVEGTSSGRQVRRAVRPGALADTRRIAAGAAADDHDLPLDDDADDADDDQDEDTLDPPLTPFGPPLAATAVRAAPDLDEPGRPPAGASPPLHALGESSRLRVLAQAPALTEAGALVGTPLYMAPELWVGDPATTRSDVYSVGALLYDLAAGRPPYVGRDVEQVLEQVLEGDPRSLADVVRDCDPRLAAVVDRCLTRDPGGRYADAGELREALERALTGAAAGALPTGNPYLGLSAFGVQHRTLFFGRAAEVRGMIERLRGQSALLVAGDSGVGKSSLCRAGVAPLVLDGTLLDGRAYTLAAMVPGRTPVRSLALALSSATGLALESLMELVRDRPEELGRELLRQLAAERGILLIADQLEELLTLGDKEEVRAVADALVHMDHPGLRLLATIRADYLTRLSAIGPFGDLIERSLFLLRPMDGDELREAIVGPARAKGVKFESDELVADLVAAGSSSAGALPLLQFTLAELWDKRDDARKLIPSSALTEIGGVDGSLARHADGIIESLLAAQRPIARRILVSLVTAERTRARLSEEQLGIDVAAGRSVLQALVRGRLLVAGEGEGAGGATYEIAHEALIASWAELGRWLDQDTEHQAALERLRFAAAEWERLHRSPQLLWRDRQLADAARIEPDRLRDREREFMARSRSAARRRRLLRWGTALGIPLALATVYGGVRLRDRIATDREVAEHVATADDVALRGDAVDRAVLAARARAFALFDAMDLRGGELAWQRARDGAGEVDRSLSAAARELENALMLDPDRRDVRRRLAAVLYHRALVAERDNLPTAELLERLDLYDDGELAARWRQPASLDLTSEPAGAEVTVASYAPRPDGHLELGAPRRLGRTPLTGVEIPRGSHLLILTASGRAEVRYPLLAERGERLSIAVPLPDTRAIPPGFVHVPAGRFRFGARADEDRRRFYTAVPEHERSLPAFLIARHETTYGEWIEFLDAQADRERRERTPRVGSAGLRGFLELGKDGDGTWVLTLQPTSRLYRARKGEPIRYQRRRRRATQDWLRWPVTAISWADASAYVAWLRSSGRVSGARLCREDEWERAARGADGRTFPHGETLDPDDANFDVTYDRVVEAYGPDEVGSHPASRSPFGLDDMTGNAYEMTASVLAADQIVARGGAYYYDLPSSPAVNRQIIEPALHDPTVGLRICADPIE